MHPTDKTQGKLEDGQTAVTLISEKLLKVGPLPWPVETTHIHDWTWGRVHPFILVLYDAKKDRAFWLDIQTYIEEHPPSAESQTLTVRIPTSHRLAAKAIDGFRKMSLARTASLMEYQRNGASSHQ